jgi:tRNA1(Val) A37 N6-methylase TrmN6
MFLYDFVRLFRPKGDMLDVGCGCGILGLLLKRDFPSVNLSAIDIQEEHIFLAKKNCEENRLNANVIVGDFASYEFDKRFDFIVSNPPFYRKDTKKSADKSLVLSRYADSLPIEILLAKSAELLKTDGSFIFCYDAKQIDVIFSKSAKNRLKICDIRFIHSRADKDSSLVLIRVKKDCNSSIKTHPPIFVFEGESHTKEAKNIFKIADTKSVDWV